MIKTFKYITDLDHTYGVSQLGLKKNDTFVLIDTNLNCVEQTCRAHSVYRYEYTISISNQGCCILDEDEWLELIMYSEYVHSQ